MYGSAGFAYVYLIYGIYHCLNIVTEVKGCGSAVLIRAAEPIKNVHGRTQGPGLLCKALNITRELNGSDLLGDELFIIKNFDINPPIIIKKPRIGIDYAQEWKEKLLRFYIKGNLYVSRV